MAASVHYRRNPEHSRKEALLVRAALQLARVSGFTPSPAKPRLSLRGKPGYPCFTKKHTPWRKAALYEARTGMDPWVSPSHGALMGEMLMIGMRA